MHYRCRAEVDGLLCIPDDLDSSYVPSLRPGDTITLIFTANISTVGGLVM